MRELAHAIASIGPEDRPDAHLVGRLIAEGRPARRDKKPAIWTEAHGGNTDEMRFGYGQQVGMVQPQEVVPFPATTIDLVFGLRNAEVEDAAARGNVAEAAFEPSLGDAAEVKRGLRFFATPLSYPLRVAGALTLLFGD